MRSLSCNMEFLLLLAPGKLGETSAAQVSPNHDLHPAREEADQPSGGGRALQLFCFAGVYHALDGSIPITRPDN